MWAPLPPERPPIGWWVELERAEAVAWAEGLVADRVRAERVEHLRARCHEVDMKLAGVQSADRWNRIQRRRDPGWDRWRAVDPAWAEWQAS